jgi:hypothetical protein
VCTCSRRRGKWPRKGRGRINGTEITGSPSLAALTANDRGGTVKAKASLTRTEAERGMVAGRPVEELKVNREQEANR